MIKGLFKAINLLLLSVGSMCVLADNSISTGTELKSEKTRLLANSSKWKTLLHYRKQGLSKRIYSEVDDDDFFFSATGKTSSHSELVATIEALKVDKEGDDSARCRFPARLNFISRHFPELKLTTIDCPKFDKWKDSIQGDQLFLIFPASYLNSPSSMFGHTMLRLDGKQGHTLLSSAINFSAYTDPNDDEITFTIKGLTGGYPGYVSLVPYYEKVNEYNHIESRDIWEYKLTLSQPEIDEFILHIWELNEIRFDYYFIDENCSYRLLTILDAVNPEWQLSEAFTTHTIPTDTVRSLYKAKLISDVTYRPSKSSHIESQRIQMTPRIRVLSKKLSIAPMMESKQPYFLDLSAREQAQALELAYDYSRYLNLKKKMTDPDLPKRSLQLLSLRSKVSFSGESFNEVKTPEYRDEQGHDSYRSAVTLGRQDNLTYAEYGTRVNYHDWLDASKGFRRGAQIEMLNARIRVSQNNIRLNRLDLLNIRSVGARNRFNHPISWQVNTGYERWASDNLGHYHLKAGGGAAYEFAPILLYGMGVGQLAYGQRYAHHNRLGLGVELGLLIQRETFNFVLSGDQLKSVNQSADSYNIKLGAAYALTGNQQLRFQWERQSWNDRGKNDMRLSYVLYH